MSVTKLPPAWVMRGPFTIRYWLLCVWWYGNIIVLDPCLYGMGASRHTNKLASSTAIANYRSQSFISANKTAKQKGRNEPQILNECNDCLQYFKVTESYTTIR